ncbi:hypothetical protein ACWCQK_35115, partial [Streptomyces sp. NPDC002306]
VPETQLRPATRDVVRLLRSARPGMPDAAHAVAARFQEASGADEFDEELGTGRRDPSGCGTGDSHSIGMAKTRTIIVSYSQTGLASLTHIPKVKDISFGHTFSGIVQEFSGTVTADVQ